MLSEVHKIHLKKFVKKCENKTTTIELWNINYRINENSTVQ